MLENTRVQSPFGEFVFVGMGFDEHVDGKVIGWLPKQVQDAIHMPLREDEALRTASILRHLPHRWRAVRHPVECDPAGHEEERDASWDPEGERKRGEVAEAVRLGRSEGGAVTNALSPGASRTASATAAPYRDEEDGTQNGIHANDDLDVVHDLLVVPAHKALVVEEAQVQPVLLVCLGHVLQVSDTSPESLEPILGSDDIVLNQGKVRRAMLLARLDEDGVV